MGFVRTDGEGAPGTVIDTTPADPARLDPPDSVPARSEPDPGMPGAAASAVDAPVPAANDAAIAAPIGAESSAGATAPPVPTDTLGIVAGICPYLLSEDGTWRAAEPRREHRCSAVDPPAPLSTQTQRRLCLVDSHRLCAAFRDAQDRRARQLARDRISPGAMETLSERRFARTIPVALEGPRPSPADGARERAARSLSRVTTGALAARVGLRRPQDADARPGAAADGAGGRRAGRRADRRRGALAAAATMTGVLVAALVLGRQGDDRRPTAAPPAAAPSIGPVASEAEPSATARARPTPRPTRSAAAAEVRTYRVKRGDTLSEIAGRFDTTVEALKRANGIRDARRVRAGQVLKIP